MEKIFQDLNWVIKEAESISKDIFAYNPGNKSKNEKISLENIQYSIAVLMRHFIEIYVDIGEKIKKGKE